ncbi:methyl-accepting chemotaxis protein [Treponema sp.]|uniref:methyl-accepting chemotaxis protein n=1 Tax=Treponema sp. TaxID=166 RepID=UPI0025D5955C|nr:methyl-accepting chemotaxis protein [Treponema sp.]MCR5218505.1 hypothetical protein [Treponema sp.]
MSFRKHIIIKSFLPDGLSAFFIFMYTSITLQISVDFVFKTAILLAAIFCIFQFTVALLSDMIVYKGISERMKYFETKETTIEERTELLEELHHLPFITAIMTFIYFIIGEIIVAGFFIVKFNFNVNIIIVVFMQFTCASFLASLFGDSYCRKICNEYAVKIVAAGVDKNYVEEKNYFGNAILTEIILFVILPLIFTTIIACAILIAGYSPIHQSVYWEPEKLQINRMFWTCILNIIVECAFIVFFYVKIYKVNYKMSLTLKAMLDTDIDKFEFLECDLSNEQSYSNYMINQLIEHFKNLLTTTTEIGNNINNFGNTLTKISNETETTSVEQSTGTKEIVATMVDVSQLSHDIEDQIQEVSDFAQETFDKVTAGSDLLNQNLEMINQIAASNEETIFGIKDLNSKINRIWEITNMINSIADQTKIIAFNAELEATSVKNENRNFKNVSSEIRRLANSTMDSTKEIKDKINEIQASSNELIKDSQSSTKLIRQGTNLASFLEERFSNIKKSAQQNALSSSEIKYLINQQNTSFDQIVKTLQQINFSIQDFSVSTKNIIDTTTELQTNAEILKNLTSSKDEDYEN